MNQKTKNAIQFASKICYSTKQTLNNTYESTRYILQKNIEGDICECGVAACAQLIVVAATLQEQQSNKKIFAVDSFQGIPLISLKDKNSQPGIGYVQSTQTDPDKLLVSSGITVHGLEQVKNNILTAKLNLNRFTFIKGWVEKTLPFRHQEMSKLSLIRLDLDLYFGTKIALKYLYPKLSDKGVCIIDDWALDGARTACLEYFQQINYVPNMLTVPNSTPQYFYK